MPRRLNYTGRKKINRADASIRLQRDGDGLSFVADLRLADYKLDQVTPPPRVYVEAYRGASTLWKRFDFGRVGTIQAPEDRSLDEFAVPEGILFRVKVSAEGDALGKLLAEADKIHPRLPDEQDDHGLPLIQHVPADDIGEELWRVDFDADLPQLKVNSRVPMGVDQFLVDPLHRAVFAPAVMRQVLTRILVIERDTGDEEDETDWRVRWIRFASRLPNVGDCPGVVDDDITLEAVEGWINDAVQAFTSRAGLFNRFAQPAPEGQS
ncbi:MAG: hypothetical protein WBD40_06525 [Tepidisphaeraceae bacterium]